MFRKPAIPKSRRPFPRIPVDQTEGSDFRRVLRLAIQGSEGWTFSAEEGPYFRRQNGKPELTPAQIVRGQMTEALLYLLEMGVIDVDDERLNQVFDGYYPPYREGR